MVNRRLLLLIAFGIVPSVMANSGLAEDRTYAVAEFDRIYFSGAGTVRLIQDGQSTVSAHGRKHTLDQLIVETSDGTLFIESRDRGSDDLILNLSIRDLRELVSNGRSMVLADSLNVGDLTLAGTGAGSFRVLDLEADELQVSGSGGAEFSLSGQVNRHVIDLEGSGDYRAENLISKSVEASISGVANVSLSVVELLDIHVSGAAHVRYIGSPYVSQKVSGTGSVERDPGHSI